MLNYEGEQVGQRRPEATVELLGLLRGYSPDRLSDTYRPRIRRSTTDISSRRVGGTNEQVEGAAGQSAGRVG